ncbi:Maf family protein [Rhodococcus sp. NPDC127528]|uniref:Maf family protein n=1 Tax=unclassified Rhodococcus (in: high G+C Gram-positive bacteria) TaxID=192944 RepID=UPI003637A074
MTRLVLASASPARRTVLRKAGIEPHVHVSGVDEDAIQTALGPRATPQHVVTELARAKASAVLPDLPAEILADAVVIGCDSMLLIDGELQGKPHTADVARARWRSMAGRSGTLLTGHCVLRVRGGAIATEAAADSATVVHFGTPSGDDLEAYLDSGEPMQVAGAFTLDGLGGWFIDRIEGDPSSVIGIGLPLVRRLLGEVGVGISELWTVNRPD